MASTDLTKGNVTRQLVLFVIPFFFANFLQALYNLMDVLIVGWFATTPGMTENADIIGVTNGAQIMTLILNVIMGLSIGITVLCAKYFGQRDNAQVQVAAATAVRFFGVLGVVLAVGLFALARPMAHLISVPGQQALARTVDYLRACALGLAATLVYNAISAVLRGLGDSRRPMYIVVSSLLLNLALDYYFVAQLGLGALGAALATSISQIYCMVLAVVLYRRAMRALGLGGRGRFDRAVLSSMLRLGMPAATQQFFVQLSFTALQELANSFGGAASTAYGYVGRLNAFAVMPSAAFLSAISAMVGQNMGAKRPDRAFAALRSGFLILLPFGICMTVLASLTAPYLLMLFNASDSVLRHGVPLLRICAFEYTMIVGIFCLHGCLTGMGRTMFTMVNGIISSIVIRVPLAYVASSAMGFAGIGVAISFSAVLPTLLALVFLLRLRRRIFAPPDQSSTLDPLTA